MDEKKDKKLYPGDIGYPGGSQTTTVYVDGEAKSVYVKKDSNGNIVFMSVTGKIFGIF